MKHVITYSQPTLTMYRGQDTVDWVGPRECKFEAKDDEEAKRYLEQFKYLHSIKVTGRHVDHGGYSSAPIETHEPHIYSMVERQERIVFQKEPDPPHGLRPEYLETVDLDAN